MSMDDEGVRRGREEEVKGVGNAKRAGEGRGAPVLHPGAASPGPLWNEETSLQQGGARSALGAPATRAPPVEGAVASRGRAGRAKGSWRWEEGCRRLRGRDPRASTSVVVEVDEVSSATPTSHYGRIALCCVARIHGKSFSEHGKDVAVCWHTAKSTRQKTGRQRSLPCVFLPGTQQRSLPCAISRARQNKVN